MFTKIISKRYIRFTILAILSNLRNNIQIGDAAAVNELWNTCKSSWDLQPYRNIAFSELELGDKLGSGSFGTVMKGVWNRGLADKLTVAVKLIPETFQFDILDLRSEVY